MLKILLVAVFGLGAFSLFHFYRKNRKEEKGPVYVCKECNENDCECFMEEE